MKIGLTVYDLGARDVVELANAADELGFFDLWIGEHLIAPIEYRSEHPTTGTQDHRQHVRGRIVDPSTNLVDPLVTLAAASAATSRLRFGTAIYLLALRHPLLTARMTATLHDASGGRFDLGVGSGWLEEEFDALGVPFGERISRYEEAIDVLRRSWAGGPLANSGKHYPFVPVQVTAEPLPIRLILGGNTEPAMRRAARIADGWFASGTPPLDDALRLRERMVHHRLDAGGQPFPLWFRVSGRDPSVVQSYRDHGFEHVLIWADQVWTAGAGVAENRRRMADVARSLGVSNG